MGQKKRRNFTEEFKIEAVRLLEEKGYTLREASESLGVSQNSLSNWRSKFGKGNLEQTKLDQENKELRRKLARSEEEREILKKALGYFAAEIQK